MDSPNRTEGTPKKDEVIVPPETTTFSVKPGDEAFETGEWFVPTDMDSDVFADSEPAESPEPPVSEDDEEEDAAPKRTDALTIVIIVAIVALILMVVTATVILWATTMRSPKKPAAPADTTITTTTLAEGAVADKPTTTTTTATSTTTTTTTTMRSQNNRVICSTCSYVYAQDSDHCPACANEGVSCDSICPTCKGAHNTEEGQAWEFCSFCASYFVVTDGEVHTCKQCGASGLTPQEVDPVSGKCDDCKNSTHHCEHCNAPCDASLTYKNKMACADCYSYAVKNVCPHCNKAVNPETEMCPDCNDGYPNRICPGCGIGKFESGTSSGGAYCEFCGTKMV